MPIFNVFNFSEFTIKNKLLIRRIVVMCELVPSRSPKASNLGAFLFPVIIDSNVSICHVWKKYI